MGGRGSFSMSHGGVSASGGGGGSLYVSKKTETRPDIRQLFINELGFKELYGTGDVPTAQLGALAIQLKKSEKTYKTLSSNKVYLSVTNKPGVKGAAALMKDGSMVMFVNPSAHSSVSGYRKSLRQEQKSGFKTRTDGRVTNDFSYTVRHEYGHLTEYTIMKKSGKSASTIRSEVQSIAAKKYGAKSSHPSKYGSTNDYEYFAESFASMTGGSPNVQGKALRDWFKRGKR